MFLSRYDDADNNDVDEDDGDDVGDVYSTRNNFEKRLSFVF